MFVIMYLIAKIEDRSKFLTKLDLFKEHNITLFMQKNGILHFYYMAESVFAMRLVNFDGN